MAPSHPHAGSSDMLDRRLCVHDLRKKPLECVQGVPCVFPEAHAVCRDRHAQRFVTQFIHQAHLCVCVRARVCVHVIVICMHARYLHHAQHARANASKSTHRRAKNQCHAKRHRKRTSWPPRGSRPTSPSGPSPSTPATPAGTDPVAHAFRSALSCRKSESRTSSAASVTSGSWQQAMPSSIAESDMSSQGFCIVNG